MQLAPRRAGSRYRRRAKEADVGERIEISTDEAERGVRLELGLLEHL